MNTEKKVRKQSEYRQSKRNELHKDKIYMRKACKAKE